jgi:aldehyde dehydrogenase (NAD+)
VSSNQSLSALPASSGLLGDGPRRLLVGGRWVDAEGGRTIPTRNPATGEVLAELADGSAVDVDHAVAAARAAFEGPWRRWKPYERQRALERFAELVEANYDEISMLDTLEMGAPWTRMRMAQRSIGLLHWFAAQAVTIHGRTIPNSLPGDILSYTLKEPVGVVGAIIPWNGPATAAIWKLGPVLATGCTVVLKPAEEASLSSLRLAELAEEAGYPEGVVNVVTGRGETAGAALAAHPDVDKIAFTGSPETARHIVRASAGNMKRLTMELGGKSPNVVFADADLESAIPGSAMAAFMNCGQVCSAGTRLLVEKSVYDEVVDGVIQVGKRLRIGPGIDPRTEMGPLVSERQLTRVLGYLDIGTAEGATLREEGGRLAEPGLESGYFVAPSVFTEVRNDMRIAQEEIFGPVVAAIPFSDIEEVARVANANPYGLGSGIWTRDVRRAHKLAGLIRAGSVWVNCYQAMDAAVPFGGYKLSGYGRESGVEQIQEYLNVKAVWLNTA